MIELSSDENLLDSISEYMDGTPDKVSHYSPKKKSDDDDDDFDKKLMITMK
jgi:hypothetical protein